MDHYRKNHNSRLFARMGGPFQRMFVLLEIFGDDLDPQEISRVLQVSPDQSYRKGEERPRGSQFYKTGGWILKSGEIQIDDDRKGEETVCRWIERLPGDAIAWHDLTQRFNVRVRLVGYSDQWNADFTLPPTALSRLALFGVPLQIDPYLSLDEDDE